MCSVSSRSRTLLVAPIAAFADPPLTIRDTEEDCCRQRREEEGGGGGVYIHIYTELNKLRVWYV